VSILLAQYDTDRGAHLASVLEQAGYAVNLEVEEAEAIEALAVDVVVIGDGRSIEDRVRWSQRLREVGYLGAIVVLGVEASDAAALVDAGADDFVLASADDAELIARVQSALRRVVSGARRRWGPVQIDRVHRTAVLRGHSLPLTAREYAVLSCLIEAGGEVVSRADLLHAVWAREEEPGTNLVEVHLSRLRDKLGADAGVIETVRRAGYRLRRGQGASGPSGPASKP